MSHPASNPRSRSTPAEPGGTVFPYQPRSRPPAPTQEEDLGLSGIVATLLGARFLILAAMVLVGTLGVLYALSARPVYRADALVQVEEKNGGMMGGLKELSAMFGGEAPAQAEMEIIRSRSVVATVVDQLRMDLDVQPQYFPVVGRAVARRFKGRGVAPARFGLERYAWGGERIQVQRLDVPDVSEREAQAWVLVAGEAGRYTLEGPEGDVLLEGRVGQPAQANDVSIFVTDLRARAGTRFRITKVPRSRAITSLQDDLKVSERGKNTGIIYLMLDGYDREQIVSALDAVTRTYVRQNVARRSEEAEKTLEFINAQLPELKAELDAAEVALKQYRAKKGTVDLGLEAQAVVTRSVETERAITELELQRSELLQRFTDSHPALSTITQKLRQLRAEQANINSEMKGLPADELASVRLMRDVKVSNELYLLLLNKAQELRVLKSGTIGNVRIIDSASVALEAVGPKRGLIVAGALFLGLALGVALAFVRRTLRHGVEDPNLLEQETGLPVYASLPYSAKQASMVKAAERGRTGTLAPLALSDPSDLAIESLRSLRTSLQFALVESQANIVLISGPRPAVGKSFVSVNLAHVLADSGQRVLLVDADMRKGQLQRYFNHERGPGLSDVIRGEVSLDEALRTTGAPDVTFLPTGKIPPNPSELLASDRFRQLLAQMRERFDLVLIDAPPILAVTDAAVLGRMCGVTLLVIREGLHPMRELHATVARFEQNGVHPNGFVFNGVTVRSGGSSAYSYHYHYEYK